MEISVIIPTLNEETLIGASVQSAREAGADEVVVVDGGSQDETARHASEAGARVSESSCAGRAIQLNRGAELARGEVLVFLHADNRLAPDALHQIRHCLADPQAVVGAFQQRIDSPRIPFRLLERGNTIRARWFGLPYGDQGIFIRRATFQELGGFPPLPIMEDLAFMRSCRRLGRPIILAGPLYVSSRRWERRGIVRQTLRNWGLLTAYSLGVSPTRLAKYYPAQASEGQGSASGS